MYKPDIKAGVVGGTLKDCDEVQVESRKHVETELPLKIGTRVTVTDDKGLNNEVGTIVDKNHVFGAGYEYLVEFDRIGIGWSENLWTDKKSDKRNLLWCTSEQITKVH